MGTRASRAKWITGVSLIVAAIAGLAAWALLSPGALAYYKTPSEVRSMARTDRMLRIGGRVVDGSLERDGRVVAFTITDGTQQLRVEHRGEVPDTLKEGTDAIVEGHTWTADGAFAADRVQAKCSSKFVPKDRPGDLGNA
jgi:cytochrome c-type biogenesis protein CcmE